MQRVDMKFKCPYYKGCYKNMIYCDSLSDRMKKEAMIFKDVKDRDDYIDDFCGSYCWQSCVHARLCEIKYDGLV